MISNLSFGQDSLYFMSYSKFRKEYTHCAKSKNKRLTLDSLIVVNEKTLENPYQERSMVFEKLLLFNLQAAVITMSQKKALEGLTYFNSAESWVDSLRKLPSVSGVGQDMIQTLNYVHANACVETYFKDTTLFFACNCNSKTLFPGLYSKSADTLVLVEAEKLVTPKRSEHFGEMYDGNILRLKPNLVSDSVSIDYFKKNQSYIMEQLVLSKYLENEAESNTYLGKDTVIIHFQLEIKNESITRKCSIAWSSNSKRFNMQLVNFFSQMKLYYLPTRTIDMYVPLVVGVEGELLLNGKVSVLTGDDHFRLLYEKMRPIRALEE